MWLLTNRLNAARWFPERGCGREDGKPAGRLPLLDAEKESDMARPTQSEPSLGLDRRQLLASAAALSVGTVPGIEAAAEVTNSGQAVPVAQIARSETAGWNVCAGTAQKIKEIAARNIIRAEAGLPLLSVPQELRRMKQITDAMVFEEFAERHRQAVWDEVLGPMREAKGGAELAFKHLHGGIGFPSPGQQILHERFAPATSDKMRPSQGPDWGYQRLRKPYCKLKSGR